MYTVKCKKNQWHAKQLKSHYWATTTGKSKKLRKIGVRKVSQCKGDLVCKNKKCSMYMAHQVSNAINFKTIQDEYRCKHCDQFAKRDWCRAQKAIEYNSNTKTMMIWHLGLHKCTLKPGHKSKEQEYQGKEALKTVMHKFSGLSRNAQARA